MIAYGRYGTVSVILLLTAALGLFISVGTAVAAEGGGADYIWKTGLAVQPKSLDAWCEDAGNWKVSLGEAEVVLDKEKAIVGQGCIKVGKITQLSSNSVWVRYDPPEPIDASAFKRLYVCVRINKGIYFLNAASWVMKDVNGASIMGFVPRNIDIQDKWYPFDRSVDYGQGEYKGKEWFLEDRKFDRSRIDYIEFRVSGQAQAGLEKAKDMEILIDGLCFYNTEVVGRKKGEGDAVSAIEPRVDERAGRAGPPAVKPAGEGEKAATITAALRSSVWPQEKYGHNLYICRQSVQQINFAFGNASGREAAGFRLVLEVPSEVKVLDPHGRPVRDFSRNHYGPVNLAVQPAGEKGFSRYVLSFSRALKPGKAEAVQQNMLFPVLLKLDECRWESAHINYYLEAEGMQEKKNVLTLTVLPPFRGRQPSAIDIGMFSWFICEMTADEQSEMLQTWRRSGINVALPGGEKKELNDKFRRHGMSVIDTFWWFWWNDEYLKSHPEATAVDSDNKTALIGGKSAVCPSILINEDEAIEKGILSRLRQGSAVLGNKGYWWDLEGPGSFHACFCPRCLKEFKRFAGLSEKEYLNSFVIKARYREKWLDFTTWQTSQILKKLQSAIKEGNPANRLYVYLAEQRDSTRVTDRGDWHTAASYIDVAQPPFYNMNPSDLSGIGKRAGEFVALVKKVNKDIQPGVWLRTGSLRNIEDYYHRYPELVKLMMLKCIAHGLNAGVYFWWDEPLDGRFYRAIAEASVVIADFEDFLKEGIKNDSLCRITPESKSCSYAVWEKDGCLAVFLFNHDPEKDVEMSIELSSLLKDGKITAINYDDGKALPLENMRVRVKPLDISVVLIGQASVLRKRVGSGR